MFHCQECWIHLKDKGDSLPRLAEIFFCQNVFSLSGKNKAAAFQQTLLWTGNTVEGLERPGLAVIAPLTRQEGFYVALPGWVRVVQPLGALS